MNAYVMPGLKRKYMPKVINPNEIIEAVCYYFGLTKKDISNKCRKRDIIYARQMAIYLLCLNTNLTLVYISTMFGDAITDHTTVLHSRDKITSYLTQRLQPFEINFAQNDLNKIQNLISNN